MANFKSVNVPTQPILTVINDNDTMLKIITYLAYINFYPITFFV